MKIIDNFLDNENFKFLQNIVMGDMFPWYFNNFKSDGNDLTNYQFTHTVFKDQKINSEFIQHMDVFLKKLNVKEIFRIKFNLTTRTHKIINQLYHTDYKNCTTSIFYFNTNNGKTIFKNGQKINSLENRMVIFDSNLEHAATTHTDEKIRVVLNINFK